MTRRARRYLYSLQRDPSWVVDKTSLEEFFRRSRCPLFDPVINIQIAYSGLELTVLDKPDETFNLQLFSSAMIESEEDAEWIQEGEYYLFHCGTCPANQCALYINQFGQLCGFDDDDKVKILSSSFEKIIEQYALRNSLYTWDSSSYYPLHDEKQLLKVMKEHNFTIIDECSDMYSIWWRSRWWSLRKYVISKEPMLINSQYSIHVYSTLLGSYGKILAYFDDKSLIKR